MLTPPRSAAVSQASVLLVEDDEPLRRALTFSLITAGYSVSSAGDETAALRLFARHKPDVVVSDLMLPEGEGMNAVQTMRAAAPEVPIVVMSGGGWFPSTHLLGVARSLGANAAMNKPFAPAALVGLVRDLLPTPQPAAAA